MKKLLTFTLTFLILSSVVSAQAPLQQSATQERIDNLYNSGIHLEKAGVNYTTSKLVMILGSVVGGAVMSQNQAAGGGIIAVSMLSGLTLDFVGDSQLKKAGRSLKHKLIASNSVVKIDKSVERVKEYDVKYTSYFLADGDTIPMKRVPSDLIVFNAASEKEFIQMYLSTLNRKYKKGKVFEVNDISKKIETINEKDPNWNTEPYMREYLFYVSKSKELIQANNSK
jgi:hypothetical protein